MTHLELDKNNPEFDYASNFIKHTDRLVYLTGKAGTGKTTFLRHVKSLSVKNSVILAPTGVAAINAGGVTIHSFFNLPFGPFLPNDARLSSHAPNAKNKENIFSTFKYSKDKRKILEKLELLIIDEVSMVRCDTLDVIDRILRVFRGKMHLSFGGVQVLLIGDTFQLPPIADSEQWNILSQFYETPFFFSSLIIQKALPVYIELKKIYRQTDQDFIDLLNRIRINNMRQSDFELLNSKYEANYQDTNRDHIILATHNKIVQETNLTKLEDLSGKLYRYEATIEGKFSEKNLPTDLILQLKVGAQVMFIKNDNAKKYYNGKIGKVVSLNEKEINVEFDDGSSAEVQYETWEQIDYTLDAQKNRIEEQVVGTFKQFPIKLAWAITVHKSQGLTFNKVVADLSKSFAPGQVYVALSRCTSFDGLVLKTPIDQRAIKTDPNVLAFASYETPSHQIDEQLNSGKADALYQLAWDSFRAHKHVEAISYCCEAMILRNDAGTDTFKRVLKVYFYQLNKAQKRWANFDEIQNRLELQRFKLTKQVETEQQKYQSLAAALKLEKSQSKKEIKALKDQIEKLKNLN